MTGTSAAAVAGSIEAGIREGRLAAGQALPTVRELAATLGVSPGTVAHAYRELRARGLCSGAGRRGTTVNPRPPLATSPGRRPADSTLRDLASGNPDPELLPDVRAALLRVEPPRLLYEAEACDPSLVSAARNRLEQDGIPAAHLTVVGGALDGIERALASRLSPGDRVAVEDPCYPGIRDLLLAMGFTPVPVALDARGARPEAVESALRGRARALVLAPRAQNPTGAAIDATRAADLAEVLRRHPEVLLVEDDHAGRVAGVPAVTVAGPGTPAWVHVRSVSKTLGPDLRLALLAGDPVTVSRVEGRRMLGTGWVSHLLQRLVAELWSDPDVGRQLDDAAATYGARRDALVSALSASGREVMARSGYNVWIPVDHEDMAVAGLALRGWAVLAGERFRIRSARAIRVSAATLRPEEAARFVGDLAEVLAAPARRLA
ncbi:MAG: aminotransferase class I/II-fold pyridoxal phosphate-dependent enzyme [Candidatus Dormibacteria bacterium]